MHESDAEPFLKEEADENDTGSLSEQNTFSYFSGSQRGHGYFTLGRRPILSLLLVFISTSLLWVSILLWQTSVLYHIQGQQKQSDNIGIGHQLSHLNYHSCGTSLAAARTAGCKYDILSNHWVPHDCIDPVSIAEYQTDNSWFGYADENRTQLIDDIDTMGGQSFYYTSERDHIVHCAMLWRKQFRAFFHGGQNLDSIILDEEHTMHCSQYLMDMTEMGGPDLRKQPIKVFVGMAGCFTRD